MVGIVIVSHSSNLALGVKEIASQMAPEVKIECAGGTEDNLIGTDINKITNAIKSVYNTDGVLILFDLGSALMNTEMAIEFLDDEIKDKVKDKVKVLDVPIAEGAVVAAVSCSQNKSISEIEKDLIKIKMNKIS